MFSELGPIPLSAARWRIANDLWQTIWQHRQRVCIALGLLITAKLAAILVPLLLKSIVDALSITPTTGMAVLPVFLLLGYALLRFASNAFNELRDMTFAYVTQQTVADFTARTFAHLHHLGARFHTGRETGAVVRDLEKGTAGIGFLLGVAVFTIVPTMIEIAAVVLILVSRYGGLFLLTVLATFVAYATYTVIFARRRTRVQRRVNALEAEYHSRIVDSLLNYDTVKFFARESFESRRLAEMLQRWTRAGVDNQYALSTLHIGQSAIIGLGLGTVMLLAAQEVVAGRMTVGDVVLINAYMIQISLPLNALGFVFRETNDALTNIDRLFALLDAHGKPGEEGDIAGAQPLVVQGGEIRFDHVDFGYESGRQILWDVSFTVGAGETVAVVGGSGSGKSTLARLLFRLYQPDTGTICIDGQDLRRVTAQSLRESIGIVPQDTILFNDTLAYNIAYGRDGASLADVIAAARGAQLDAFIEGLPDAYETRVGERGVRLSGGERQRVAIARALLKRPPIIIFDEATSALDTRSERAIQTELMRAAQGRTSLIIAHRLSTVIDADRILVLDHGRLVEMGSHSALLAAGGVYAHMWSLQVQQRALERTETQRARHPVSLHQLLEGVWSELRAHLSVQGIDLSWEPAPEELIVLVDAAAVQDLLAELGQLAAAAGERGLHLRVRTERSGKDAWLILSSTDLNPPELSLLDFASMQAVLEAQGGYLTRIYDDDEVTLRLALPLADAVDQSTNPIQTDSGESHVP